MDEGFNTGGGGGELPMFTYNIPAMENHMEKTSGNSEKTGFGMDRVVRWRSSMWPSLQST